MLRAHLEAADYEQAVEVPAADAGGDLVEADVLGGGAVAAEVAAALAVPAVHLAPGELPRAHIVVLAVLSRQALHALEDAPRVVPAEQRHAHERARRRVHAASRRADVHHAQIVAARLRTRARARELKRH